MCVSTMYRIYRVIGTSCICVGEFLNSVLAGNELRRLQTVDPASFYYIA